MRHSKPVRLGNRTYRGGERVYLFLEFTINSPRPKWIPICISVWKNEWEQGAEGKEGRKKYGSTEVFSKSLFVGQVPNLIERVLPLLRGSTLRVGVLELPVANQ